VRVLLADDEILLRAGLARLLEDAGIEVVSTLGDLGGVPSALERTRPDVVILDLDMPACPGGEPLAVALIARRLRPRIGVLATAHSLAAADPFALLDGDARGVGYLLKARIGDVDEFLAALRRVADGGAALDSTIVAEMVARQRRDGTLAMLSRDEREVLALMAEGRSNHGIGARLGLPLPLVERDIASIFAKLGLDVEPTRNRRVMAVLTMLRAA
jgi:DNA-binding NarL/FixJ family response regulator